MSYIDNVFENNIRIVVNDIYTNLQGDQKDILQKYLVDIIDFVATKFNFSKNNKYVFYNQLTQNDNEDIKSFLNMLLPFVDDTRKNKREIKNLNDIYIAKQEENSNYEFSNLQYGRCKRLGNGDMEEINFNMDHLAQNYYLLKDTIQIVSNKLHVNWINIRPYSLDTVKEKDIYILTKKSFENNNISYYDPVIDDNIQRDYRGLYTGDIYNTIRNYLYEEIVPIKWLIFDVNVNNNLYQIINILPQFFNIEFDIKKDWNQLNDNGRRSFTNRWESILNAISTNRNLGNYDSFIVKYLIKVMTVFFDKKFGRSDFIIDLGYKPINIKLELDDEIIREDTNDEQIMHSSLTITAEMGYNFIISNLRSYSNTWYGKQKDTVLYEDIDNNIRLTLKNIYNYAKSLSSYREGEDLKSYPKHWRGLTSRDKDIILSRLNFSTDENVMVWFNIGRYIKYTYTNSSNIEQINNNIHKLIKDRITDIIFDVLITQGILTEFAPLKELTDKKFIPKNTKLQGKYTRDTLKRLVFDKDMQRWENSYYFITNTKFSEIINNVDGIEKSYLQSIIDGDDMYWMGFYAFSWVSQIALFHRYLNCRVIYITGATGVGKSAAVPRLMLYGLKMLDYKSKGKIINSQPRQSPTESNPTGMSKAMGVPMMEYDNNLKINLPTDNFYLQYKHKKSEHTGISTGLTLKVVTDGTMYQMIKDNPICKSGYKDPDTGIISYRKDNIYDIFMIDEAHEHNKYMDMILTLLRYSCYYNNDIRLVIVSATMEDDEPIYRRYYRDINDNRLYPLNHMLIQHNFDRINIDRRVHISPPGETTRYKIDDYYRPGEDADDIVVEIINKTTVGEILLFRPGLKEIGASVDNLLQKLPNNVIILPFHSKLTNDKRNFIENLTPDSIRNYTLPRDIRFDVEIDLSDVKRVPPGTYTRAVIIATTIAEASITINSLVYVVDTGTQKVEVYDYDSKTSVLVTKNISDASRKQRRGRVGRKAPGEVYYTYEKGLTEQIKKQFDISISDISSLIFDLLRLDKGEDIFIKDVDITNAEDLKYGLDKIILDQYYYKGSYVPYIGDIKSYDYENSKEPPAYYQTGYSSDILYDSTGKFYIVHPEELQISRDILGNIIKLISDNGIKFDKREILSNKMLSFFDSLAEKRLAKKDDKDYIKTDYGSAINQLISHFTDIDPNLIISYLYSRKYGVDEDILKLISMYKTIDGNIKNIAYVNTNYDRYNELKSIYSNQYGDSIGLINMADDIINNVQHMNITTDNAKTKDIFEQIKIKYLEGRYQDIEKDYIKKLKKADHSSKLIHTYKITKEEIESIFGSTLRVRLSDELYEKHADIINSWAKGNYMNSRAVYNFLNIYIDLVNNFIDFNEENEDIMTLIDNMSTSAYTNNDKNKLIIASLLHGFGHRVSKRIGGSRFYIMASKPSPKKTYVLRDMDTLIEKLYINKYVIYGSYNPIKDTINIIDNVTPHMIQRCIPNIFHIDEMNSEEYTERYQQRLIKDELPGISIKDVNLLKEYLLSVQELKQDMIDNYTNDIYEKKHIQLGGYYKSNTIYEKRRYYTNRFVHKVINDYIRRYNKI